jgi:hypothetical protein
VEIPHDISAMIDDGRHVGDKRAEVYGADIFGLERRQLYVVLMLATPSGQGVLRLWRMVFRQSVFPPDEGKNILPKGAARQPSTCVVDKRLEYASWRHVAAYEWASLDYHAALLWRWTRRAV